MCEVGSGPGAGERLQRGHTTNSLDENLAYADAPANFTKTCFHGLERVIWGLLIGCTCARREEDGSTYFARTKDGNTAYLAFKADALISRALSKPHEGGMRLVRYGETNGGT